MERPQSEEAKRDEEAAGDDVPVALCERGGAVGVNGAEQHGQCTEETQCGDGEADAW